MTANNTNRVYGAANPEFTVSCHGFVNVEGPNSSSSANPASLVGDYPITVMQGTLSNANFSFLFTNGTLSATPAPAPVIISIGLTNEVSTVAWSSMSEALCDLQSGTHLINTNWSDVLPKVDAHGLPDQPDQCHQRCAGPILQC